MPSLNFRLSDNTCQFNKETKISCPASLKQNEGFIYADNPDRGENILRANFALLVTSKTEESGKHNVKGIGYVIHEGTQIVCTVSTYQAL